MSTIKVTNIQDTSGNNSSTSEEIAQGRAKAWVNFDGTGTVAISDSFNVSSITDNAAGNYTVTMTNALGNANYCLVVGGNSYNPGNDNWTIHEDGNHTRTTTTFRLFTNQATSSFDSGRVCAAVFGD